MAIICFNGIKINNYVDLLTIVQSSFLILPPLCIMAWFVILRQYHSTTDLKRMRDVEWNVDTLIYLLDSTYRDKKIHYTFDGTLPYWMTTRIIENSSIQMWTQ